jgi:aspartate/methionine/tyrosine aminotransferase
MTFGRFAPTVYAPHSPLSRLLAHAGMGLGAGLHPPPVSERILSTDEPCIVATKRLVSSVPGTLSLAQGIVHWQPPPSALKRASEAILQPSCNSYGPDEGSPELREALKHKLNSRNGLYDYDVQVTAGANQAFANVVISLLDPSDTACLFVPYYFNHLMAIQMTGGANSVLLGPCDPKTFHPDLEWLASRLAGPSPPKMVVLVNPCNPTGVLLSREELDRAVEMCARAGCWLVIDNTYEDFVYGGRKHYTPGGPHVVHIFSFSKAYGMMGWRQGYIAYPSTENGFLASQLLKVQDTIPICPTQISQEVALGALEAGPDWVAARVRELDVNRNAILDALSPLGTLGDGIAGGEGAIYLWARLPDGCEDDGAVVEWLVRRHKVCLIPGSSCGCPGHVRVAFANLVPSICAEAAVRLKKGLEELVSGDWPPSGPGRP